jgi:DNA-binding transcriptional LysR family regulator
MESYALVVKLGSFTRAANELQATRAMVSKRIQELEAYLGVKLLNRNTHGLSVTAAGADYYEHCVPLLSNLRRLNEQMQEHRVSLKGEIKLFANKTFSETVLGPIVCEFCSMHPDISVRISLINRDTESYGMHLVSGGYDLAVISFKVDDASYVARPIGQLAQVLVAAPDYLRRRGAPQTPQELAGHNCLDPSGNDASDWMLDGPGGKISVRVTGSLRTNGTLIIRRAALDGLGIAVLREYLVADDLRDGLLVRVLEDYEMDKRTVYLVYQKDAYQPLRVRTFADYLIARLAQMGKASPVRRMRAEPVSGPDLPV